MLLISFPILIRFNQHENIYNIKPHLLRIPFSEVSSGQAFFYILSPLIVIVIEKFPAEANTFEKMTCNCRNMLTNEANRACIELRSFPGAR